jgi:cobalt-zinc-cadmium efflux system outer membrane protein
MDSLKRRALCASMFLGLSQWSAALFGAEQQALTLRKAIEAAMQNSPAIAALAPETELLRQQSLANSLPPATTVETQLENFSGTGEASGTKVLETTLQLSHVIELGGKLEARRGLGASQLGRLEASQRTKRADIAAEVARRFVHVLSDQEQLRATRRATDLAERSRDAVNERIKAGATSPIFLSRAEIALTRARIEQEHAEHELASSRVALAVMLGEREPSFSSVSADLFELANIEPLERYLQRLESNPELLSFAADARVLDAKQRLAQSHRAPNVTLNAGVRRLEALDDQALLVGFSVPLGARKRSEPELAAVRYEREHLALSEQSRRLELHATLFALYQEVVHARTEATALREAIMPEAERVLRTSDEGYRAGRFSLVELADAQRQLLEIERDAIRAAAEFHTQLIEIERLTGEPVHALANEVTP